MYVLKKSVILCIIAVVISVVLVGTMLGIAPLNNGAKIASTKPYTLVIDAGHGGVDSGVTGVSTKVKESDINLAISKKLSNIANNSIFNTVMTRKTADGLYGLATNGFKQRDMKKRKEIINNSGADFVISIHQNRFSSSSRRGIQVFYSDNGNKDTIRFAEYMQNYLNITLNIPTINRSFACQNGDFYIVKCSNIPTIIIECGFLSNVEDEKLLIDTKYQDKLVSNILSGLIGFISDKNEDKIEGNI